MLFDGMNRSSILVRCRPQCVDAAAEVQRPASESLHVSRHRKGASPADRERSAGAGKY
jgi:hypothetical protein